MKKFINLLILTLSLLWVSSCSNSNGFEDYYGADNLLLCSVNLYDIMDNAGFDFASGTADMPAALKQALGPDSKYVKAIASVKGADPRKIILVADKEYNVYALMRLTDANAFVRSLREVDFADNDSGGFTVLSYNDIDIVIDGDMAIAVLVSNKQCADCVKGVKKAAAQSDVPGWQSDILSEDNACNMIINAGEIADINSKLSHTSPKAIYDSMYEGGIEGCSIVLRCSLDGLEAKLSGKLYDKNGKSKKCLWYKDEVNKDLLKYTSANDFMVSLLTISGADWKGLLDKSVDSALLGEYRTLAKGLYADLNGQFMLSAGYRNIHDVIEGDLNGVSLTLAAGVDGDAADKLQSLCYMLAESGLPCRLTSGRAQIDMPGSGTSVCLAADGSNLIISLSDTFDPAGCRIKAADFSDESGECVISINANSPQLTYIPIPFGIELKYEFDDEDFESVLKLTGTDGKLLENILNFVAKF